MEMNNFAMEGNKENMILESEDDSLESNDEVSLVLETDEKKNNIETWIDIGIMSAVENEDYNNEQSENEEDKIFPGTNVNNLCH